MGTDHLQLGTEEEWVVKGWPKSPAPMRGEGKGKVCGAEGGAWDWRTEGDGVSGEGRALQNLRTGERTRPLRERGGRRGLQDDAEGHESTSWTRTLYGAVDRGSKGF